MPLSPEFIVSCDYIDYGCNGGSIHQVIDYLSQESIVTQKCIGYEDRKLPSCPIKCSDGSNPTYRAGCVDGSKVQAQTEEQIKYEIYHNGPMISSMIVFDDLLGYKRGIYSYEDGEIIGSHAILLVGYGEDSDGTRYWEV